MIIYNLTQHALTEEQRKDGILELPAALSERVKGLLNFEAMPWQDEVQARAEQLAVLALEVCADGVMLGGAPFLMSALVAQMKQRGIRTFFAFSQRRSREVQIAGNTVEKRSIFCYEGLIEV